MSLEKAEIKRAAIQEVGVLLDDALESASSEILTHQGGQVALVTTVKAVGTLLAEVDKDVDEGRFSDLDGPLAVAKVVKLYVQRAMAIVESHARIEENFRLIATGKVEGLKKAVALTKKIHDVESAKAEAMKAALDAAEGAPGERVLGTHPGATIKELRQAEEKSLTEPVIQPQEGQAGEAPAATEEPRAKKPRRRSKDGAPDGANA